MSATTPEAVTAASVDYIMRTWQDITRSLWTNVQNITCPYNSNNTTTINNFAGNRRIEEVVVSQVASYGTQLGWISEALVELARKENFETKEIKQLSDSVERIKKLKAAMKFQSVESAKDALDVLKREDPETFRTVIEEYCHVIPRKLPKSSKK